MHDLPYPMLVHFPWDICRCFFQTVIALATSVKLSSRTTFVHELGCRGCIEITFVPCFVFSAIPSANTESPNFRLRDLGGNLATRFDPDTEKEENRRGE